MSLDKKFTITFNRFPELIARFPAAVGRIVIVTGKAIEADVKVSMAQPKHGRTYKRKGKNHRASAPGESPAVDSGALVNSIGFMMAEPGSGVVFTNQEYAPALEYGYARMSPRPYFAPAVDKERPEFIRRMSQLESNL